MDIFIHMEHPCNFKPSARESFKPRSRMLKRLMHVIQAVGSGEPGAFSRVVLMEVWRMAETASLWNDGMRNGRFAYAARDMLVIIGQSRAVEASRAAART